MTEKEFRDGVIRYRMFTVNRVPVKEGDPGNKRRVRITDTRRRKAITITVSSDLEFYHSAAVHLENLGIFVRGFGMGWESEGQGCVLLSENFHTPLGKLPHA